MTFNKVQALSLDWALAHLSLEGDGDLFPRPFEIDTLQSSWSKAKPMLEGVDVSSHPWHPIRRVLIPKDETSFRRGCQLDPADGLLFSAIVYECGSLIEQRRRPISEHSVFSYRFSPAPNGTMYAQGNPWRSFWQRSSDLANANAHVAVLDISDFYNQIYHHSIENQLKESGVPGALGKALLNLLAVNSEGVSRGIPTGPHASNLLAEMALIPLDDYIALQGWPVCRFVDDLHIFCDSHEKAQNVIFQVADFLDKTQKLYLNKQKTEILPSAAFLTRAIAMLIDNPINDAEEKLLRVIGKSGGPYTKISLETLSVEDLEVLSQTDVDAILSSHLETPEPNFIRLRWFLRRLAQSGISTSIPFVVANIHRLLPAIGDAAAYLNAARDGYSGDWLSIGDSIITALSQPVVIHNEYLQMVLYSLFSRILPLNHISKLIQSYNGVSAFAQREIMVACGNTKESAPWLQVKRADYMSMDGWQRRAFLFAIRQLPKDERSFWLKNNGDSFGTLESLIAKESKAS